MPLAGALHGDDVRIETRARPATGATMSATEVTWHLGIVSPHLLRHRRVEDRHHQPHVVVQVPDEQRHPQRERILARGHADHVGPAVRERGTHVLVARLLQPGHVRRRPPRAPRTPPRRGRRRPSGALCIGAQPTPDVWRDLRARQHDLSVVSGACPEQTPASQRVQERGVRDGEREASRDGERDRGARWRLRASWGEQRVGTAAEGRHVPGRGQRRAGAGAGGADVRQRHVAGRVRDGHGELRQPRAVGRARRRHRRRRRQGPRPRRRLAPARDRHRRPEGPGHLRGQPVLRGQRERRQLGGRPRARRPAGLAHPRPDFNAAATRARRSPRSTRAPGCRAASRSCTPSRPAPATRPAARTPARRSRRSARPRSSTGSTAAARATRPGPARPRSRPLAQRQHRR